MDGQGNSWPVDGTLSQFSAPAAEGLSQARTFQTQESSPYHSDISRNEDDTLDLFKQPQESLASPYSNQPLSTELPDFFKLPWGGTEQASSDPLVALPSLLNVENLGNIGSEEISAACLENNNRIEPGIYGAESSWSGGILSAQSAHDSRSYDNPIGARPGLEELNLADKLLFSTPTTVKSNTACIAQNSTVTSVNLFSQHAFQTKDSTGQDTQNSSPACVPFQENSYHAASSMGENPTETEQSIPMQSDLLSSLHRASSNVAVSTPQLCHSSGYKTHAGQTDQDLISIESKLLDEDVRETGEIGIDDTFSLQFDPPSFSDDESDIKSPKLCADLTRISNSAEQWCTDPSNSQDDKRMRTTSLSSDSHKQSFFDIVLSPRQQKQGSETQNQINSSSIATDLDPTPIPASNSETVTENSQESRQDDLQLEDKNTPFTLNSNSSASMKIFAVHQTRESSEKSSCEVQQESVQNPKKIDSHLTDSTLIEFDSDTQREEDIQGDLHEAEQDVPLEHTSGSFDLLSSRHSKKGGDSSNDVGSSSSEESVILLSDIECDAEDKGKLVAPVVVKNENPSTPERACQNEAPERIGSDLDDKRETIPDGSPTGAALNNHRFNVMVSLDTRRISANNSLRADSSDVREEAITPSAKDKENGKNKSMAQKDASLTERGTAKNKLQLESNKDNISGLSKDKLSKVKCQADVLEISDDLSDAAECKEHTDVSMNQAESSEKGTTNDVEMSNLGGDISRGADTPISLGNLEEVSFSQDVTNKTADGDSDKRPTGSEVMQTKNSTSQTPQTKSLQKKNDGDDDVIIIDEDPEIISVGSSDEDEMGDNLVSKPKQVTTASSSTCSASKKDPASETASKSAVKKTEWACHMCGDRSKSLNSLKLHVRRVHNLIMIHRKEDMKCKLCPFTGTWQKIKDHIINDHDTPLKWYIKNHETKEIIKLPSSALVPPESPKTSEKTTSKQPNQPGEACKQKTTPVSKQHYLIKRVANIQVEGQDQSTSSMMTRREQPCLRSRTVTSSSVDTSVKSQLAKTYSVISQASATSVMTREKQPFLTTQTLTSPSVGTSVRSQRVTNPSVNTSSVTFQALTSSSVNALSTTTQPIDVTSSLKANVVLRVTPTAVNKPLSSSAPTSSKPSNFIIIRHTGPVAQSSSGNFPKLYPVFPGAIQTTASTTSVRPKVVYASTLRPAAQTSLQKSILVSQAVTQQSGQPILCKVSGSTGNAVNAVDISHLPYQQRVSLPNSLPQNIPKLALSQLAGQKTTKTILRVVSNPTGQGSASKTQVDMSAAKALLNAICLSSRASTSTTVAPRTRANVTVSTLLKNLSMSAGSSPSVNAASTNTVNTPATASIIKTAQPSTRSPSSCVPGNQSSSLLTTTCKAKTVTTQSSGPVTNREITVQRTVSDSETMASYVIRVPKSRSDGNFNLASISTKKDEDSFYLVKVPVNLTNSPKKFLVHLPIEKDSSVKHAVCIVQPPSGESGGIKQVSSAVVRKTDASKSSQKILSPNIDSTKTLGQIKSMASGHDRTKADDNVHQVVPLKITKTRGDLAMKAECLAHLQEPPVNIHLLESQFKDTKVFQAADLIKVDDRVQYECARCKETFPQLMLLQLHLIDCTIHPPSSKVLPIVHIPTALLAALFELSPSGYSSTCAICKVLLLGYARNVEDQQDFCSHLAKHTEPQVAITSLDDTRKLGIPQTRMTSQQAKEWVDYLVPPFKMWNKPTSAYDGSLDEYVCTEGILHRESVIRGGKHKRSLSPQIKKKEKHKKHKKHQKHKRHNSSDIEVSHGRSNQGARSQYRSSVKTAEGCEGEWIEPSPKDFGKLLTRRTSQPGKLKESIMRSPSHPKLLQHGMQVNFRKSSKNSPSKASQRVLSVKIPDRRSQRGMGLDFGQGLMMLPMTSTRKVRDDAAKETVLGMNTKNLHTPSKHIGEGVIESRDDYNKNTNKPAGREVGNELAPKPAGSTGNLEEGQKSNSKTDAVHKAKDLDDIVVISSDDDEEDSETKDNDIHGDGKEYGNRAPHVGIVDAGEKSDSKDALSDNLEESSSDDEDADEQQSDMDDVDDELDEDKDESNRRDIPLTMMALHYRRLNETMAESKDEDSEKEMRIEESPSPVLGLSDNEQEEDNATKTPGVQDDEKKMEMDTKCQTSPGDQLQEVCSSPQLITMESPVPARDARISSEGSSQGSNSIHPRVEYSNRESESLEPVTFLHDEKVQHNIWKLSMPSETQFEGSTKSKPEAKNGDSQPSKMAYKDVDSEPQDDVLNLSEGEVVDILPQDNVNKNSDQEKCILDNEDSHSSKVKDTTSDARILDWNVEDLNDIDEISVEGSFDSENSNQGNITDDAPDNIIPETKNYEDGQSKDSLSVAGIFEKQTKEDSLLGDNVISINTKEDKKISHLENSLEDSLLEDDEDDILEYMPEDNQLDTDTHEDETPKDTQSSMQDKAVIVEAQTKEDSLLEGGKEDDILDYIPQGSLLDTNDTTPKDSPSSMHNILDYIPEGSLLDSEDKNTKDRQSGMKYKVGILEAEINEDGLLEGEERDNNILDCTQEGLSCPDTFEDKTSKVTHCNFQENKEKVTDDTSQIDDDFSADLQENDRSGVSSAEEACKAKSHQERISENDIVEDSIQKYYNLESASEDLKLKESDQRHSAANKTSWDNCSVDALTGRSTQRDRFFREKNLPEQNISDGSQTDETVGQSLCTSEEESDANKTTRRDRFFSERSLDVEDSLGFCRVDAVGYETASSTSFSEDDGVKDVFQKDSCVGISQGSDDGVKKENPDTRSHQDEEEDSDDIICILDDSDDEDMWPSLSVPRPGFEATPPTVHSSLMRYPSPTAIESHPSKANSTLVRNHNLKRKSSHDHDEETGSEDEAYRLKRSKGDEDCVEVEHPDSWCLLEESEDSDEASDPDTVWKREVGSSVFTREDIGQLQAGGL